MHQEVGIVAPNLDEFENILSGIKKECKIQSKKKSSAMVRNF